MELSWYKPIVIGMALALLWMLESIAPQFVGRHKRLSHNAHNLALGLINAAIVALGFAALVYLVCQWAQVEKFGLVHWLEGMPNTRWPVWSLWMIALISFDFWMYCWHVLNHKLPLLWRFHSVHHTDRELDVSSALRFHSGEIILSAGARLAVLPLLGMSIEKLLVYELILQPVILFHHSNVRVPRLLDRALRMIIVTPWMHWVHHSDYRPETDSNYASVLSVWDRLFDTFRLRDHPEEIQLGLKGYESQQWRELSGMLASPFASRQRSDAEPDPDDRPQAPDQDQSNWRQ